MSAARGHTTDWENMKTVNVAHRPGGSLYFECLADAIVDVVQLHREG